MALKGALFKVQHMRMGKIGEFAHSRYMLRTEPERLKALVSARIISNSLVNHSARGSCLDRLYKPHSTRQSEAWMTRLCVHRKRRAQSRFPSASSGIAVPLPRGCWYNSLSIPNDGLALLIVDALAIIGHHPVSTMAKPEHRPTYVVSFR